MKLTVHTFTTIDGVMQGPVAVDEDPSDGSLHCGWIVPLYDADTGTTMSGWFERADEILIRRPENVVSHSLTSPAWQHSSVISGNVVERSRIQDGVGSHAS